MRKQGPNVISILAARRYNRVGFDGQVLRTWAWATTDQLEGYRVARFLAGIDE